LLEQPSLVAPAPKTPAVNLFHRKQRRTRAGEQVFIVTRQQKDGWEGHDKETSEIVPAKAEEQQAIRAGAVTLQTLMHKGCTSEAQGDKAQAGPEFRESGKAEAWSGKTAGAGLGEGGQGRRKAEEGRSEAGETSAGEERSQTGGWSAGSAVRSV
jgi:hypothetical protein